MGNVCQGGVGQAPARQATIFAGELVNYYNQYAKTFLKIILLIHRIT